MKHPLALVCLLAVAACGAPPPPRAAPPPPAAARDLLGLDGGIDLAQARMRDATASLEDGAVARRLVVDVPAPARAWAWPGISLPLHHRDPLAPAQRVECQVVNCGQAPLLVAVKLSHAGADGDEDRESITERRALAPGERALVVLRPNLPRPAGIAPVQLWHMWAVPPWAVGEADVRLAIDRADRVTVFAVRPTTPVRFAVEHLCAEGVGAAGPVVATPLPFVDRYGQYRHEDWPGKIHADVDLARQAAAERAQRAADPGPAGCNRWGGDAAGPQLAATGFFRTEKLDGRWWLVDPDGRRFFCHALHGVRFGTATPLDGRDSWFAERSWEDPAFADCLGSGAVAVSKHYQPGVKLRLFNFFAANLRRKHGAQWRDAAMDEALERLPRWGFTAIGANSDGKLAAARRLPYHVYVDGPKDACPIAGSEGYWGRFYDPLDPGFAAAVAKAVATSPKLPKGIADDPWCLGLGVDNELSWGKDVDLALAVLRSPAGQPAKQAFAAWLRQRHGTIAALNAAWGTSHADWDALLAATSEPDRERARADLEPLFDLLADAYFRACRDAVKAVAPHHLYTGCRFMNPMPRAEMAAARFCDVVTYNHYQFSAADLRVAGPLDRPLLITEFHFAPPGQGRFSPAGIREVADRTAQAVAYRDYLASVRANPQAVGCTWFMYADCPFTGSQANGETFPIGFVDTTDTPYPELTAAARAVGETLYR
jgi:hypothetical protein